MKRKPPYLTSYILLIICLLFAYQKALADDTCVFMVTADDVPPNIVILLDNGAQMEQIITHPDYDSSFDYTPSVMTPTDVIENGGVGNGFFNENGYSIIITGNKRYLVNIPDNLVVAGYTHSLEADLLKVTSWTINSKEVTLPDIPSTVIVNEVKDNATNFRYTKNYLNWLFFSGKYAGDGSDLPNMSRFYYAKKALMSVAKITANQAQFGVNTFTSNADGASNVQPLGMVSDAVNNILDPNYVNTINNLGTVAYSPLAEGLASVGGYYGSPSSGVVSAYCQKNFAIVVTAGVSSEDQVTASKSSPANLSDFDEDNGSGGIGEGKIKEDANTYDIPVNQNGTTYLDDVANFSSALTSKMTKCGFTITADWFDPNGSADLLLYAHNTQNPIHNQPNSNIRLTSFNTVQWTGDIGDLLRVTPGGEGQILYGISESNSASKGTVISCFGNRFILQTHPTHQYERDRMSFLWENYIYNALYARYQYLN